jgi:hypothetical protein
LRKATRPSPRKRREGIRAEQVESIAAMLRGHRRNLHVRGMGVADVPLAFLAGHVDAQDKTPEKRVSEGLRTMHRLVMGAVAKEAQCLRAIGDKQFCRCMGTKLLSMDFVQYVALIAKTQEEVDKLSPEDKKNVDVARKCRDVCLK